MAGCFMPPSTNHSSKHNLTTAISQLFWSYVIKGGNNSRITLMAELLFNTKVFFSKAQHCDIAVAIK